MREILIETKPTSTRSTGIYTFYAKQNAVCHAHNFDSGFWLITYSIFFMGNLFLVRSKLTRKHTFSTSIGGLLKHICFFIFNIQMCILTSSILFLFFCFHLVAFCGMYVENGVDQNWHQNDNKPTRVKPTNQPTIAIIMVSVLVVFWFICLFFAEFIVFC